MLSGKKNGLWDSFDFDICYNIFMNKAELHNSIINNSKISFIRSGGHGGQNVNKVETDSNNDGTPDRRTKWNIRFRRL